MTFASDIDAALAYDRWFDSPWGSYAFGVESAALLRAAGEVAGLRIADIGCGTGRLTRVLQDNGARVTGVDNDIAMLTVAASRLAGGLVLADARTLPLRDAAFDLSLAVTLCEFVADVEAVFSELVRITRPGGRFIVGSLNPHSPWGWAGRRRFAEAPWSEARFLSRRELLRLGAKHGRASLRGALFAFESLPVPGYLGPVCERLGDLVPRYGAFQVLTVQLPT